MPLDEIKRNIDEQARKEARGIRDDAERRSGETIAEAGAKAREITQRAEREMKETLKRMSEENESSMGLAVKNVLLGAREEAIDSEASKIRRLLANSIRGSKAYEKLFKSAISQAKQAAPAEDLTVVVGKRDKALVEKSGAKVEVRELGGGLLIRSKGGDVEINATLDRLMDSRIDVIRNAVREAMFAERKERAVPKAQRKKKK